MRYGGFFHRYWAVPGVNVEPFSFFTTVMDELTREIRDVILWCMLFADDIVLIDESREGVTPS